MFLLLIEYWSDLQQVCRFVCSLVILSSLLYRKKLLYAKIQVRKNFILNNDCSYLLHKSTNQLQIMELHFLCLLKPLPFLMFDVARTGYRVRDIQSRKT
jgi:hypothetical protein